ncbi:MAG: SH3 beta-barrel fold-containing protein [Chitinophagaceae bacterium]
MKVNFTKTDGTVREMICTLQESFTIPYEKKTDKQKPENNDILAVWDVEKHAWRSFRVDSIISADVVEAQNV